MKQFADLHIHTNLSDGSDSVGEVLTRAYDNNVTFLSVTDHNTLEAYCEDLWKAADRLGLRVIPGVELDVIHKGKQYHLLAYGIDTHKDELVDVCRRNSCVQEEYNLSLLRHMEKDGLGVSEKEYHGYKIPQGRGGWKLLNYLLDTGMTGSLLEGTKYYKQYGFNSNTIDFISMEDAVRVVKEASGIPILAHPAEQIPYHAYGVNHNEFWSTLDDILKTGIEGIECIHPLHGFGLQEELLSLCHERDLFISGGTDYHGNFFNKQKQTIGGQLIASHIVEKLVRPVATERSGEKTKQTRPDIRQTI